MYRPAVLFLALAATSAAHADQLNVAVASNFTAPMTVLALRFEAETGHKIVATYGATGKFYAQIQNGAPFEVLLAADSDTPARLEKEGATVPGTRLTYAIGQLVLWSAQPGLVDASGSVLKNGNFAHLALANPKLAPYGAAAVSVLQNLKLYTALEPKLVLGDNVGQTHQFVVSGSAPLGFVAKSQVYQGDKLTSGSAWIVPANLYPPLRQDAVVLAKGKGKSAALAFVNFLKSPQAQALIRFHGYDL